MDHDKQLDRVFITDRVVITTTHTGLEDACLTNVVRLRGEVPDFDDDFWDSDEDEGIAGGAVTPIPDALRWPGLETLGLHIEAPPLADAQAEAQSDNHPGTGFVISDAGRDRAGGIYVVVWDAATGAHTLTESGAAAGLRAALKRADDRADDLGAQLAITEKLLTITRRRSLERQDRIEELKRKLADAEAAIAALSPAETVPEWTQPAVVGAMGQPRQGRRFRW